MLSPILLSLISNCLQIVWFSTPAPPVIIWDTRDWMVSPAPLATFQMTAASSAPRSKMSSCRNHLGGMLQLGEFGPEVVEAQLGCGWSWGWQVQESPSRPCAWLLIPWESKDIGRWGSTRVLPWDRATMWLGCASGFGARHVLSFYAGKSQYSKASMARYEIVRMNFTQISQAKAMQYTKNSSPSSYPELFWKLISCCLIVAREKINIAKQIKNSLTFQDTFFSVLPGGFYFLHFWFFLKKCFSS